MRNWLFLIRTVIKLGIVNVVSVTWYRTKLSIGYFERSQPITQFEQGNVHSFLGGASRDNILGDELELEYFNNKVVSVEKFPAWTSDPYTGISLSHNDVHWSKLSDFNLPTGDIKVLWEPSRFEWLIKAVWNDRFTLSGSGIPVDAWLDDWCVRNPANLGINWKCAQEASIRAMHLLLAAIIRHERQLIPNKQFLQFLQLHIMRVQPTVAYARAQDNNHGTSEAAALFCVGAILEQMNMGSPNDLELARSAHRVGLDMLEERAKKLILEDGAFSQYSTNYHRLMLDTLVFSECIRRFLELPAFSDSFYKSAALAADWLLAVTDPVSGDAPNIGANDGAVLFNADGREIRDFRPTCQIAQWLFCGHTVFAQQAHCLAKVFAKELALNDVLNHSDRPENYVPLIWTAFKRVGSRYTFGILKVPHDSFRPSHSDANHLDLWNNGVNIIRDSGTYSYNPPKEKKLDLGAVKHHSTVVIDDRNQMPRLGRFLYGHWLKPSNEHDDDSEGVLSSSYRDFKGAFHRREINIEAQDWTITDRVEGVLNKAVLRFQLASANWSLAGNVLTSSLATIQCSADQKISVRLTDAIESRYYLQKNSLRVLEVEASTDVVFHTRIHLALHKVSDVEN